MLQIEIQTTEEGWDEAKEEFVEPQKITLLLEHSLIALSKWESKWHKAFLSRQEHTREEMIDYIRCMTITQHVDPNVYQLITDETFTKINEYINDPMTATTFSDGNNKSRSPSNKMTTSELIYYWMIAYNIPAEYQKWHLNRLMTLIKVCEAEQNPPKKRSTRDIMASNKARNAANRKYFNSRRR